MAFDYRGFTAWHVRTTIRLSAPMASIPPWRWLPERLTSPDAQFRRSYQLERIMGWAFAAAGAIAFVTGAVALIAGRRIGAASRHSVVTAARRAIRRYRRCR